jgi:hypothetical protein
MIDWFVVLVPLAALPIILLFAFVGCGLDEQGEGPELTVSLKWGQPLGVAAGVKLTFMVRLADENVLADKSAHTTSLEPKAGETFPLQLDIPFSIGLPSDKVFVCLASCRLDDANGLIENGLTPQREHPGTLKHDGSHWHWTLVRIQNVASGGTSFDLIDET